MKRILVGIFTLFSITGFSQIQCGSDLCGSYINLPINDQNAFNNLSGSKCIAGTGTISNNLNFNNWQKLSFNGNILVQQNVNQSAGFVQHVFTQGVVILNRWTIDNKDTLFNFLGTTYIVDAIPNNTGQNVVVLAPGARVFIQGTEYFVGQFFQEQGNTTNRINIISCQYSILSLPNVKPREEVQQPSKLFKGIVTEASGKVLFKGQMSYSSMLRQLSKYPQGLYFYQYNGGYIKGKVLNQ